MSLQRFGTMHMTSTALCGGGAGGQPRPRSGPPPPALQRARGRAQGWRDRVTPPRGGLLAHAWGRPGGGPWQGGEYLQFRRIQTGFFGVLEEVLQGKRTGGREQGDGHAAATLGPRAAGAWHWARRLGSMSSCSPPSNARTRRPEVGFGCRRAKSISEDTGSRVTPFTPRQLLTFIREGILIHLNGHFYHGHCVVWRDLHKSRLLLSQQRETGMDFNFNFLRGSKIRKYVKSPGCKACGGVESSR